jgi:ABC-type uncharacterized transport system involved in gliding motility auxiliary subunit
MEGLKNMNPKKGLLTNFLTKRSTRYGVNMLLMILIFLGIIIFIEAISIRHHKRIDLTEDSRYSLSQQSRQVLSSLQKDVKATAFYKEGQRDKDSIRDLLDQFVYHSKRFKFEFIDPDRNPVKANKYKIDSYGTIVVESNGRQEKVYMGDEEKITNAILKATSDKKKTIYFVKGHGENEILDFGKDGYSAAKMALEDENYYVKELFLLREDMPPDASLLVISGPKKDFFEPEIEKIETYIEKGGRVLFMIDPYTSSRIKEFLKKYSVILGDDIIVDVLSRLFGADYLTPVVSNYRYHPITKDFNIASFFPVSRSVEVDKETKEGISAEILVSTGDGSWSETDKKSIEEGKPAFDDKKDRKGPIPVAAVVTIENKSKGEDDKKTRKASLVVFGDSNFANNTYFRLSGNGDLFLNTIGWLAEEGELIAIRKKRKNISPVVLTRFQGKVVFWSSVIFLPLTVLLIGVVVFQKRRKK